MSSNRPLELLSLAERKLGCIGKHRTLSIALVGVVALLISASLSLLVRMPQPGIHDEFSYLLAADTFAHGRLTNPTHPLWVHFESFHIIQQPTYASKFPPGQGLVLAAGLLLSGHAIVGVWISTALACAAICWMLMAWLPPRWALLGGLLAALHPLIHDWGQSYWGGAVAMAGGALLLGGFGRIIKSLIASNALVMGIGMAVLANSRPYEGMVLSILIMTALLAWMIGPDGPPARVSLKRILCPIVIVLAVTAVMTGYYNWRVTGDALRMPYTVHEETYGAIPLLPWQGRRTLPTYRHKEMRKFFVGPIARGQRPNTEKRDTRTAKGNISVDKAMSVFGGYFRPVLLLTGSLRWYGAIVMVALLGSTLWILRKDRWMLPTALLISILFVGAVLLARWVLLHYTAPAAGLFFVLLLQSMRHLRLYRWRNRPVGRFFVWIIPMISIASLLYFCVGLYRHRSHASMSSQRAAILKQLEQDGEKDLVVVRYAPNHSPHNEWAYNDADIDSAKVVWAREMDPVQNLKLLEYFKNRRIWLLEPDAKPPSLIPYSTQGTPVVAARDALFDAIRDNGRVSCATR